MGTGQSKPKNKTGKSVVNQKVETASKTGVLSLRDHGLQQIPAKVFEIVNIKTLDLSNNKLKEIPSKITTLTNIKSLNCDENQLKNGGIDAIAHLPNLQNLSAGKNLLGKPIVSKEPGSSSTKTSKEIRFPAPLPPGMKQIKLDANHFTEIPRQIFESGLVKLTKLDLSFNNLASIPSDICNLIALSDLNLDNNSIVSLPEEVGKLNKLKALSLQHNQIRVDSTSFSEGNPQPLPASLFTATPLIDLNLQGNKMTNTQLNEFEGFASFLERRQAIKSKNIYGGALTNLELCGLE